MEAVKETFEVTETAISPEPKSPTRDELKANGWSARELESAEKRGMIATPKKADEEEKKEVSTGKDAALKAPTEVAEEKKTEEKEEPKIIDRRKNALPDFTFQNPEQEKAFLDAFGPGTPQRAMYFRMKNERQARQAERTEKEAARAEVARLRAENEELKKKTVPADFDEDGNPVDPDDKPLTLKQLRELQKKEAEEIQKKNEESTAKVNNVAEAQRTQEEYVRSSVPDFDNTVEMAKEVMQNLDTLIPEKWRQAQVVKMIRDLQTAAAKADEIDLDDYHAAWIAYEIGKFHPKYGKSAEPTNHGDASEIDGNPKDPKKANGGLTPGQMKRIEENTQRRASSASIPGSGGKRTVSAEDIDLPSLNKMSYAERQRFREKHPDRYAKLLRG